MRNLIKQWRDGWDCPQEWEGNDSQCIDTWDAALDFCANQLEAALDAINNPKTDSKVSIADTPSTEQIRERHDDMDGFLNGGKLGCFHLDPYVVHTDRGILLSRLEAAERKAAAFEKTAEIFDGQVNEWHDRAEAAEATLKAIGEWHERQEILSINNEYDDDLDKLKALIKESK